GMKIDAAGLFGVDKPTSWPYSIHHSALAAGNIVTGSGSTDFGQDVAALGELIAKDGFSINGFASRPGLKWKLVGMRRDEALPISQANLQDGTGAGNLYGSPIREATTGSWDATAADLIAGDWSKAIIGMRQDITWKMFDQGVISDADGAVVLNLMQ